LDDRALDERFRRDTDSIAASESTEASTPPPLTPDTGDCLSRSRRMATTGDTSDTTPPSQSASEAPSPSDDVSRQRSRTPPSGVTGADVISDAGVMTAAPPGTGTGARRTSAEWDRSGSNRALCARRRAGPAETTLSTSLPTLPASSSDAELASLSASLAYACATV
jgi:hypothetical protein